MPATVDRRWQLPDERRRPGALSHGDRPRPAAQSTIPVVRATVVTAHLAAQPPTLARLIAWLRARLGRAPSPVRRDAPTQPPEVPTGTASGRGARGAGRTPDADGEDAAGKAGRRARARRDTAVVRRPLLDRRGGVAGFEFMLSRQPAGPATGAADPAVAAQQAAALLAAMRPTLQSGQLAVAALPLEVAVMPIVIEHLPVDARIALTDVVEIDARQSGQVESLRRRGAVLGGCGAHFRGAQFVLIDAEGLDAGGLSAAAEAARRAASGIEIIAVGLPDVDAIEAALVRTVDLAGGSLERRRTSRSSGELPARAQQICALINAVLNGTELPELAAALRADVGLSYQLLRHVNSAWIALPRTAQSIDDAVMLIGRDGLFRWLAQMLAAEAPPRASSRALQEVALARARLMELLAEAQSMPGTPPFTTGLLSLLDVMMGLPIGEALAPLHLPQPAIRALVNGDGPWHPMLDLVRRLEQRDMQAATELAELYGGLEEVSAMAEAAWRMARLATSPAS